MTQTAPIASQGEPQPTVFNKVVLAALLSLPILMFVSARFLGSTTKQKSENNHYPAIRHDVPEKAKQTGVNVLGSVPDFRLIDTSGAPFGLENLSGKYWIANFIFTRCGGPCPAMSQIFERIQEETRAWSNLRLVSFTVDPKNDTPELLANFAKAYNADPQRWHFLTGTRDAIYDLCAKGFRLSVFESKEGIITHSSRMVLVDSKGKIRGYYESQEQEKLDELRADLKKLIKEEQAGSLAE